MIFIIFAPTWKQNSQVCNLLLSERSWYHVGIMYMFQNSLSCEFVITDLPCSLSLCACEMQSCFVVEFFSLFVLHLAEYEMHRSVKCKIQLKDWKVVDVVQGLPVLCFVSLHFFMCSCKDRREKETKGGEKQTQFLLCPPNIISHIMSIHSILGVLVIFIIWILVLSLLSLQRFMKYVHVSIFGTPT